MEKIHHLDFECVKPTESQRRAYCDFMYNPANICNCAECPERDAGTSETGYPCGQQNCWVSVHCESD